MNVAPIINAAIDLFRESLCRSGFVRASKHVGNGRVKEESARAGGFPDFH